MKHSPTRRILTRIGVLLFVVAGIIGIYTHFHISSLPRAFSDTSGALARVETPAQEVMPPATPDTAKAIHENTQASPQTVAPDVKLLFGGDLMFDRYIRGIGEKNGYDFLFAKIHDDLVATDGVIANLEGPITSQPSVSVGSVMGEAKNYVFTFDPKVAQTLWNNNIRTVNLGNNHILNFKESGLAETRQFLAQSNIAFFGDPKDISHSVVIENIKGVRVAFVNYNQFAFGGKSEYAMKDIAYAKSNADIVVVYTHWGVEYVAPPQSVKNLAHEMIDAGADVIIGSHPHIVQESEMYKGKKIYYSLGNFVFDQFFRDDTKKGLMVQMTIHQKDKSLSFEDKPITLDTTGQVKWAR